MRFVHDLSTAATSAAAALEPGSIINDFYHLSDYVHRRVGWLGTHPQYKHIAQLVPIARHDAEMVFHGAEQSPLSVQEVRRRELACGIDPLLPLPTTENCSTVDEFVSYPDREWSPSMTFSVPRGQTGDQSDVEGSSSRDSPTTTLATKPMTSDSHSNQDLQPRATVWPRARAPRASGAYDVSPPDTVEQLHARPFHPTTSQTKRSTHHSALLSRMWAQSSGEAMPPSANIDQDATSPAQSLGRSVTSHSSSPSDFRETSSPYDPKVPSSAPTTPMSSDRTFGIGSENNGQASTLDNAGNSRKSDARGSRRSALHLQANLKVASYSGRGVDRPVKQKRTRTESGDVDRRNNLELTSDVKATEDATPSPPPPSKKRKRSIKAKSSTAPKRSADPPPHREAKLTGPPVSTPAPQTKKATRETAAAAAAVTHMEAIISGAAQPTTPAEAHQASTTRLQCLLAKHPRPNKTNNPDFMPEFFHPANYPPGMEDDSVRCACGLVQDDGAPTIQCDGCRAWQHIACMRDAVPTDPEAEGAGYRCQVCDPWAHRRLVARLRKQRRVID